jgi:hypothetical protein
METSFFFLGNGTSTFSSQMTYSTGVRSQPYSVAVDNFNNDTLLDIAVASYGAIYPHLRPPFIHALVAYTNHRDPTTDSRTK